MAEDLRRFLHDEPILARPPSLLDKAVKWTRRHKSLAASAMVMLALAAVGLLVSTLLIAREQGRTRDAYQRERERATEATRQREEADLQRARAERSFTQARDVVGFLSRVAADELATSPGSAEVRKEMLEAALDYYQGFAEEHRGDSSVASQLAEAQAYVSKFLAELSAFADFDRVQTSARLLSESSVQQALKLSADQIQKADGVSEDSMGDRFHDEGGGGGGRGSRGGPRAGEGFRDFGEMTLDEKQKRFADSAAKVEAALTALLTPPQAARLRQITRQVRGPAAFGDKDVAEALALTRGQKDAVRKIQAEFRVAMRKPPARRFPRRPEEDPDDGLDGMDGSGMDPNGDLGTSRQSITEAAVQQLLAQLNVSQIANWKRLAGEPFSGKLWGHYGTFGPGGPRHDDRDGSGIGHDGPGGGSGSDGLGHDGPGRNGPGHDGPGGDGPGHDGPEHDGFDGDRPRTGGPGRDGPPSGGPGSDGPPGSKHDAPKGRPIRTD